MPPQAAHDRGNRRQRGRGAPGFPCRAPGTAGVSALWPVAGCVRPLRTRFGQRI